MTNEAEINKLKLKCAVHDANYDVMCRDIKEIKTDIKDIKGMLQGLDAKYADREQFLFYRNVLVLGVLVSIMMAFVGILLKK